MVYLAFAALVLPVPVGATGDGLSACTAADSALALTKDGYGYYFVSTNAQLANVCRRCASLDYLLIGGAYDSGEGCSDCAPETLAACTGLLKLTGKVDAVKPSLQALRGAGTGPASSLLADL